MTDIRTSTSGDVFEIYRDVLDVTSMNRPHVNCILTDTAGHTHRWHVGGKVATDYDPSVHYEMPSLVWVKDGEEFWEDDDEPHEVGHHECRICGERVAPPYTADIEQRYIPGLIHYRVNGVSVSKAEFDLRRSQCPR